MTSHLKIGDCLHCVITSMHASSKMAHGCATQSGTHRISLFQFPTDQKIRKCWIDRLNRGKTATTKFVPSKHSKICMKHFDDSQFLISPKFAESIGFGQVFRVRLKPDAVPTIFDNPRKKSSKERNSALAISKKKMKHEVGSFFIYIASS